MAGALVTHLVDLLAGTPLAGRVRSRRMFGGHGLYCDARMVGIVMDDALYLKTDAENRARFEERGLTPFVYRKKGRSMSLSYYLAPAEALEDGAELARWLGSATQAARSAARGKPRLRTSAR